MLEQGRDVHTVGFFERWPGDEWLRGRVEAGTYRAGARFVSELMGGIVFSSEGPDLRPLPVPAPDEQPAGTLRSLQLTAGDVCEDGDDTFPCNVALFRSILYVVSRGRPADCILFAVPQIVPGKLRQWVEIVNRPSEVEGTWAAAGLTFGLAMGDGLVEVVGDTFDACHDRLLELVDHDVVSGFEVFHTSGELTVGFGGEPVR